MNFEDLQKVWQAQAVGTTITINADMLLKEIRRNQRDFKAGIFRRDVKEVSVLALMTVGFFVWGWLWQWWSLCLLSVTCLLVGAFFLVDRWRQRRKLPVNNGSLQACIEASLFQVNHQIWLLKNVLWWYLLPPILGMSAVIGQIVWSFRGFGLAEMSVVGAVFIMTYGFTFGLVYWVNQRYVRKELAPRRQELETLLNSLK